MNYSDYLRWKTEVRCYTGGIGTCPCDGTDSGSGSGSTINLPQGSNYSDYLYYNNNAATWQVDGNKIHLGSNAGYISQATGAIAIGVGAGENYQGSRAIAIGQNAGNTSQQPNSIVLNASFSTINGDLSNALYIAPVRNDTTASMLYYNTTTSEVTYGDILSGGGSAFIGTNTLDGGAYRFQEGPYGFGIIDGNNDGNGVSQDLIANAFAKMDKWVYNYIISQPPAPVRIPLQVEQTATEVALAFTNPIQIKGGILNKKLPAIDEINATITINGSTYNILHRDTNYIPDGQPINAIILSKVPASPEYDQIILTNDQGVQNTYNTYFYYNPIFSNSAISNMPIHIEVWYENSSDLAVNKLLYDLPPFILGGVPSAPLRADVNSIFRPTNVAETQYTISWNIPQYADLSNEISSSDPGAPSMTYNIFYKGVNSVRYGGYDTAEYSYVGQPGFSKIISNNVHPGTSYLVRVNATNSINPGSSADLSNIVQSAYPLPPKYITDQSIINAFAFATNYPNGGGTIKDVLNNQIRSEPIVRQGIVINTANMPNIAIHNTSNRGSTANEIMTIRSLIENTGINGGVLTSIQDISFNGFGGTLMPTVIGSITDVSLNYTVADYYTQQYYNGFYLKMNASMQLKSFNNIIANETLYKIHLQQIMNDGTINSISTGFRIDDINIVPTVSDLSLNILAEADYTYVCGVRILNQNIPDVPIESKVSNLARYYYVSGELLIYIFFIDGNIEEERMVVNNINIIQGTSPNSYDDNNQSRPAKAIIQFKQKKTLAFTNNAFSTTLRLSAIAKNLMGSSALVNLTENVLIDSKSLILINQISGPNIPNALNNLLGLRTSSYSYDTNLSSSGIYIPTINGDYNVYNNMTQLSGLPQELQIINGKFRTRGNCINFGLPGYANYNSYINNAGIDYSATDPNGLRFATFVWKIPSGTSISINSMYISIEGLDETPLTYNTSNETIKTIDAQPLYVYYRFEQQGTINGNDMRIPINNSNSVTQNNPTSIWIDANTIEYFFNGNYSLISKNGILGGRGGTNKYSYNSVTHQGVYTLLFPSIDVSALTTDLYIYVRIGCAMNANLSFSGIKCHF